jgi:hypothetical protein
VGEVWGVGVGRLVSGIAGLNLAGDIGVCFLCFCVVMSCVGWGLCDKLIPRRKESYPMSNKIQIPKKGAPEKSIEVLTRKISKYASWYIYWSFASKDDFCNEGWNVMWQFTQITIKVNLCPTSFLVLPCCHCVQSCGITSHFSSGSLSQPMSVFLPTSAKVLTQSHCWVINSNNSLCTNLCSCAGWPNKRVVTVVTICGLVDPTIEENLWP